MGTGGHRTARMARICGLSIVAATVLLPAAAGARKTSDLAYRYEQIWSTTVRMVRVDLGYEVREQDREIGYVLFDYRDLGRRVHPASVELVRVTVNERPRVRVVIQVPAMPSYVEQMLLDRLERKLRADFGDPPRDAPRRPEPDPEPPSDEPTPEAT